MQRRTDKHAETLNYRHIRADGAHQSIPTAIFSTFPSIGTAERTVRSVARGFVSDTDTFAPVSARRLATASPPFPITEPATLLSTISFSGTMTCVHDGRISKLTSRPRAAPRSVGYATGAALPWPGCRGMATVGLAADASLRADVMCLFTGPSDAATESRQTSGRKRQAHFGGPRRRAARVRSGAYTSKRPVKAEHARFSSEDSEESDESVRFMALSRN